MLAQPPKSDLFKEIHDVGIHPEVLRFQVPVAARPRATAAPAAASSIPRESVAPTVTVSPAPATSTIGEMTGLLTVMSSLFGARSADTTLPAAPSTPRRTPRTAPSSPAGPTPPVTPSLISRFLNYAESKDVPGAGAYKASLELNRFSPDILPDVPNTELTALGIAAGDAIRLKKRAREYWSDERLRKKRSTGELRPPAAASSSSSDPWRTFGDDEPVRYLYFFNDSLSENDGHTYYPAGPLIPSTRTQPSARTRRTYYRDEVLGEYVPIPAGFEASMPEDGIDGFTQESENPFA
jgi:hypothetical protein